MHPIYCHKVKNVVVIKYSLPVQFVSSLCSFSWENILTAWVALICNIDIFRMKPFFFSPPIILFIYFFKVTVSNLASYLSCILQKVNPAVSFPYHRSKKINKITAGQSLEVLFLPLSGSLYPQKTQHLFIGGNLPLSSWPKLKAGCEYALINLTSRSKRSESGGYLKINLNSSFISLT